MWLFDVNVAVYAMRRDMPEHDAYRIWFEGAAMGVEPLGYSEFVLQAALRIVTNHRVFQQPSRIVDALSFCEAVRSAPAAIRVEPGRRHWTIFSGLLVEHRLAGNAVPDAYLASLALEQNATWVTRDRGFARFGGLRWFDPGDVERA